MRRTKPFIFMLFVVMLFCSVFILTSCGSKDENKKIPAVKLTAPTVVLSDDIATWNADSNADKFEISLDGNLAYIENSVTSRKLNDGQTFKIRAIGDGTNYLNSDWSNSVTYAKAVPEYTIVWENGDIVLETDSNVKEGTLPSYDGTTPSKAGDAQYSYVFSGWSPEVVNASGNATYTAVFTAITNKYTITWKNGDVVLETDKNVEYGTTPAYNGAEPQKASDAKYNYSFIGWSPEISSVSGAVTYQAQFAKTIRSYAITFYSEDGITVLDKVTVEYGSNVTYSKSTPIKPATDGYNYLFEKWVTEKNGTIADDLTNVVADRNVYASFKSSIRSFSVSVAPSNKEYGSVSATVLNNIPYGTEIVVNKNVVTINGQTVTATPASTTAQYTYTFIGWTTEEKVNKDTTITANFSRSINTYTVIWKNGDTVLETDENVEYGTIPVYNGKLPIKEADSENVYTFNGWTPSVSSVTGDITYAAKFAVTANNHIVIFYDDNGTTEFGRAVVGHGEAAVYPNELPTKTSTEKVAYTFMKWVTSKGGDTEADLTSITGDISVYAKYSESTRKYSVTFFDYDGSVISRADVEYGTAATAPGDPVRDGYRFTGWDDEAFSNVMENLTVKATYIQQFTVTFLDYDNSIIDIQSVDYRGSASAPQNPERKNYRFIGWNTEFANVVSDLTVKAQYIRQYTVTFVDYDGVIISTDIVDSGDNATPPQAPVRTGYTFKKWGQSYGNIVSDMEIVALYEINRYTVIFLDVDGSVISSPITNVAHGTTVTPPQPAEMYFDWNKKKGYCFTGWKDWDASCPIIENTTITAEYSKEITSPIIAIETKKVAKGTETVKVSVYLCGSFENIYGISLKFNYEHPLLLSNDSITVNSKLGGYEATLNTENNIYEFSWANGQGIGVSEKLQVFTLTFTIDGDAETGQYAVELFEGTYIIDSDLSKLTPIIVIGHVIIT